MPKMYGYVTHDTVTHKDGPNGRRGGITPITVITSAVGPRIATTGTREVARRLRQAECQALKKAS